MTELDLSKHEIKWKNTSRRVVKDYAARIVGYVVLGSLLLILLTIFAYILGNGATTVTWKMLTTNGNTSTGGIANAIWGTWMLVGMGLAFSLPSGLFGALYLSLTTSNSRITAILRLVTDVLTSVPSIVIGLFGYLVLVIKFNFGFSLVAGGMALGVMMLPYIMRITELSFKNIPKEQVQNAYALGADHLSVAARIYFPQASNGIFAGVLLAVSIAAGETAQLIYTAGFNSGLPSGFLKSQVAYLTYVVWNGINQPSVYSHNLAFVSAMVLILTITALILVSKYETTIVGAIKKLFAAKPPSSGGVRSKQKGEKNGKNN